MSLYIYYLHCALYLSDGLTSCPLQEDGQRWMVWRQAGRQAGTTGRWAGACWWGWPLLPHPTSRPETARMISSEPRWWQCTPSMAMSIICFVVCQNYTSLVKVRVSAWHQYYIMVIVTVVFIGIAMVVQV